MLSEDLLHRYPKSSQVPKFLRMNLWGISFDTFMNCQIAKEADLFSDRITEWFPWLKTFDDSVIDQSEAVPE